MAAGDTFQVGPTSVAAGGFLDVQPGAGIEWVVHNVYVPEGVAVEFHYWDGVNAVVFDSDTAVGTRYAHNWHVTNGRWVRVKNNSGAAALIAADGMVTK